MAEPDAPAPDTRIAYGARCTWWDSIHHAGRLPGPEPGERGLPCCPVCRGVLFEEPDEAAWWASIDATEQRGNPGYRATMEWARGRCFPSYELLRTSYGRAKGLPAHEPAHQDALAALAFTVATQHGGRLTIDTAQLAGHSLNMAMNWTAGPNGEIHLVIVARFSDPEERKH